MGKSYEQYRQEIYYLDSAIANTTDANKKIELIDKDIALNRQYIHVLRRVIPVKTVFCVILSLFALIGLMIFLPQIIVRKNKVAACQRRIYTLSAMRNELTASMMQQPLNQ